jgi:hypothetical protein
MAQSGRSLVRCSIPPIRGFCRLYRRRVIVTPSAEILLPNDSSLCAPLIAFDTNFEKLSDRGNNLVRLVVLKPVSSAGYGFGAGP